MTSSLFITKSKIVLPEDNMIFCETVLLVDEYRIVEQIATESNSSTTQVINSKSSTLLPSSIELQINFCKPSLEAKNLLSKIKKLNNSTLARDYREN